MAVLRPSVGPPDTGGGATQHGKMLSRAEWRFHVQPQVLGWQSAVRTPGARGNVLGGCVWLGVVVDFEAEIGDGFHGG